MSRPLRIEFPGAIYHVTSRGDRRELIFEDDSDRAALLGVLQGGMQRFDAQVLAYLQMRNHDHIVLHTRRADLSRLMLHLNDVVTQAFNPRHRKVGHLFQGRFKAILVDRDAYLLEVGRCVELNPVARPRMVSAPGEGVAMQPLILGCADRADGKRSPLRCALQRGYAGRGKDWQRSHRQSLHVTPVRGRRLQTSSPDGRCWPSIRWEPRPASAELCAAPSSGAIPTSRPARRRPPAWAEVR